VNRICNISVQKMRSGNYSVIKNMLIAASLPLRRYMFDDVPGAIPQRRQIECVDDALSKLGAHTLWRNDSIDGSVSFYWD